MNILEAFEHGLPEIPAKTARKSYPKLDPKLLHREHVIQGEPAVLVKRPGHDVFATLTPQQWEILQLFDGERSYEDVLEIIEQSTGVRFSIEQLQEFVAGLEDKADLFYRTPLEKNITLKQKLGAQRYKRKRFAFKDVSEITLHRWPNADRYITRIHPYLRFFYTVPCTLITLVCFAAMVAMWGHKFGEIWSDSFEFYNFIHKSGWDLLQFWMLFGVMAFCHETAHGMTCKHHGGNVESIDFLLMYFSPTFICDCSQLWIVGDRRSRLYTIIAGLWFDLILCFFATSLWWMTPSGMLLHDFAYKVMMVTGIGVTLLNLNPLIKLDGYYIFSELVDESDLYERSRAFLSQWTRKHIYGLPVEVEYVPKKRRAMLIVYGILSCTYGYVLLYFVALLLYHIFRHFSPEYGWIPGLALGYFIFRSRIRKLVRLMKDVYLDKKDRVRAWFTPSRLAVCSVIALVVLFLPVWPTFVEARFLLEPATKAVIRASNPGLVEQVLVSENQAVTAGTELVSLRNLAMESDVSEAAAHLQVASARAVQAGLRYTGLGSAERERQEAANRIKILNDEVVDLHLKSPIDGVVLTPSLRNLVGSYVVAGTPIAEVADMHRMNARIFVPEFEVRDVHPGMPVRLHAERRFLPISASLAAVEPLSSDIDPGLMEKEQLSGITPPQFYIGIATIPNDGTLREGMSGTAKIYVRRRSAAAILGRFVDDLIERRFW